MKKVAVTIVLGALVATNAFAANEKVHDNKKDAAHAVQGGVKNTTAEKESAAKAIVEKAQKAGILNSVDNAKLASKLANGDVELKSSFKTADGKSAEETLKLSDVVNKLSDSNSEAKRALSSQIIEAMIGERGTSKDGSLNKLISEAVAMLDAGSKATDAEIKTFTEKLSKMNEGVRTGKFENMDEAAKALLTAEERKKLEECFRG